MPTFEHFIYRLERALRKDEPAAKVLRRVVREFREDFEAEKEAARVAKPEPIKNPKVNPFKDEDIPF